MYDFLYQGWGVNLCCGCLYSMALQELMAELGWAVEQLMSTVRVLSVFAEEREQALECPGFLSTSAEHLQVLHSRSDIN